VTISAGAEPEMAANTVQARDGYAASTPLRLIPIVMRMAILLALFATDNLTIAWLGATYLVTVLHRGSMSVAGLQAAERFEISASALASFTVVQLTVYAVMQVPVGVLLDRYGSKRLLIAASVLLFGAQSAFSLVDSYPAALAARAVLGVGDALVFISVLRVVMSWFPALRQPVMSQATGMLGGVGAIVSTVPITLAPGWRWTFRMMAGTSFIHAACLTFSAPSTTAATSESR